MLWFLYLLDRLLNILILYLLRMGAPKLPERASMVPGGAKLDDLVVALS